MLVPIKQQQVNIARIYSDWHQRNDKPIATQMQLKVAIWIALVYVAIIFPVILTPASRAKCNAL